MKASGPHKKILLCSSFTPPVNAGGGKNAFYFGSFLAREGHHVTLLSLNRKGRDRFFEKVNGMGIVRLLYLNHTIPTKLISLIFILPGYLWYVLKNQVVFVYGGNLIGFEAIILYSWVFGKKVVFRSTMFREDDIQTLLIRRPFGKLRKWILQKVDFYFSMSPALTKSWEACVGNTEKVFGSVQGVDAGIFNPAEPDEKTALKEALGLPEDTLIIISVGYVLKRKGFQEIFESLHELAGSFLYVVVGNYQVTKDHYMYRYNGEMKGLYRMGLDRLDGRIRFMGPKERVQDYLKASDVFLLGSRREGFPNALLEAMACGLPSVMRNLPEHYDFIAQDGRNIILFDHPDELVSTLSDVLQDADFRRNIGGQARQSIVEKGSFENIWEQLSALLCDS